MDVSVFHEHSDPAVEAMRLEELACFVMEQEDRPSSTECSISFVDDAAIAELNETYRGKAGPTDVLSFECDGVDDGNFGEAASEGMPYELGDIVIATDVARRQAKEYGCTLEQEVELLCVHGLLHLCGYDHIEDDEAEVMEARERALLKAWRSRQ